jgi:hypothetical protein
MHRMMVEAPKESFRLAFCPVEGVSQSSKGSCRSREVERWVQARKVHVT